MGFFTGHRYGGQLAWPGTDRVASYCYQTLISNLKTTPETIYRTIYKTEEGIPDKWSTLINYRIILTQTSELPIDNSFTVKTKKMVKSV